jgi:hypothetical protein
MAFGISATALAIGGSALIGAYSANRASAAQSRAAGEATQAQRDISGQQMDIQSEIADKQLALQREQYLKQLELNEPFRQGGLTGQNMLLAQLQGGPYASAKFGGIPGYDPASAMQNFGGVAGYDPASAMKNFGAADFQADPGYAFRLSEGMKALDRTAASRGGLLSGATLKGAQRYGSDLASQEYGNAYNRFQTNRSAQSQEYQNAFNRYQAERAAKEQGYGNAYNRFQTERINTLAPLQSLAGVGQSASQQAAQAAQAYGAAGTATYGNLGAGQTGALGAFGSAQGGNIIGAGNARASGYMGGANAVSGAVGQGLNFYQNQNLVNTLLANRGNVGGVSGGGSNYLSGMTTLGGVDRPDFDMSVY